MGRLLHAGVNARARVRTGWRHWRRPWQQPFGPSASTPPSGQASFHVDGVSRGRITRCAIEEGYR